MDSQQQVGRSSKAEPISARAYARHRGCSAPAVLKAIDRGRLRLSIVIDGDGKAKIADVALADREWAENTDLSRASGEIKERANRHRPASESPVPPTPVPPPAAPAAPAAAAPQPEQQQTLKPANDAPGDKPAAPQLDPEARWNLNDASAEEKKWKALKAELEYKEKLGELVSAKEVETGQAALFTLIRTKLLALPGKARAGAPHLTLADVAMLDGLTREVLEELAAMELPAQEPSDAAASSESASGAAA